MTNRRTQLLSLADRVEREPASRELDADIRALRGTALMPWSVAFGQNDGNWVRRVGDKIVEIGSHRDSGTTSADFYLPRYTSSLDAAVGLVPEGWNWAVEHYEFDAVIPYKEPGAKASVWRDSRNPRERLFNIEARSPAAALTAACLRALAEMEE